MFARPRAPGYFTESLIFILLAMTLTACAPATEEKPQEVPVARKEEIKPVSVSVNESGEPFVHSFDIAIDQNQGKVEYLVTQARETEIVLKDSRPSVVGCDPAKVQVEHYWFPNKDSSYGLRLRVGDTFYARAGVTGNVVVVFSGLETCSRLGFRIELAKAPTRVPVSRIGQ